MLYRVCGGHGAYSGLQVCALTTRKAAQKWGLNWTARCQGIDRASRPRTAPSYSPNSSAASIARRIGGTWSNLRAKAGDRAGRPANRRGNRLRGGGTPGHRGAYPDPGNTASGKRNRRAPATIPTARRRDRAPEKANHVRRCRSCAHVDRCKPDVLRNDRTSQANGKPARVEHMEPSARKTQVSATAATAGRPARRRAIARNLGRSKTMTRRSPGSGQSHKP